MKQITECYQKIWYDTLKKEEALQSKKARDYGVEKEITSRDEVPLQLGSRLYINDARVTNKERIASHVEDFYRELYYKDIDVRTTFANLNLRALSQEQFLLVEWDFTEEQVKRDLVELVRKKPRTQ